MPLHSEARRWTWVESAVLAGYAIVVALGIAWHEPWADEAQAWLLARDQGFWHLMLHAVRYEGSPGLWHAMLWVLARLHVSYVGMHWVSGAIAAAGVFVLLRWSPFPLVLRALLPFGFWLAYQNAVVARSYVLFAVLAFSAAAVLRAIARGIAPGDGTSRVDSRRLLWLAVILGLMANLSVHGFVASLGFALATLSVLRRRARAGVPLRRTIPAWVLCCFWIFAVATTAPPSDVDFAAGKNLERLTEKIWASFGNKEAKAELAAGSSNTNDVRPGELAPAPPLVFHRTPREALWRKFARVLALFTYPISNFRWLALAVCVLVVVQAVAFRSGPGSAQLGWIGLMPWALMVLVFTSMYLAPRHAGMLWEALVATLWLTWPETGPETGPEEDSAKTGSMTAWRLWLHRITVAALVLVALDQVWWTAHSVWRDVHEPYSGDAAMAKFLESQAPGKRVAGFYYHTVGPAAYIGHEFGHAVYFNQPTAYWIWSRGLRTDQEAPATIATHPDVIVVGRFDWNARNGNITDDWIAPDLAELNPVPLNEVYGIIPYAKAHGYRETHRFCGHTFMRDGFSESMCQIALEPMQ
jgi:hypothetical protein